MWFTARQSAMLQIIAPPTRFVGDGTATWQAQMTSRGSPDDVLAKSWTQADAACKQFWATSSHGIVTLPHRFGYSTFSQGAVVDQTSRLAYQSKWRRIDGQWSRDL